MAKQAGPKVQVSQLHQVGIVVHNLEESMKHYQNVLGIGPWQVLEIDPTMLADMSYRGRPAQHRFRIALTKVGPIQLELLQPVEGDNIYSDFLKEHGEGMHHLGHVRVENLDEAVQTLEKHGFPCVQSGRFGDGGYAYIDTSMALGTIIELVQPSGRET